MQNILGKINDSTVDHKNIQNIGIRTHDEIDSELAILNSFVDQDVTTGSYPTFSKLFVTEGSILSYQMQNTDVIRRWYKVLEFDRDALGRYFNLRLVGRVKTGPTVFIPFNMDVYFSSLSNALPTDVQVRWNTTLVDSSSNPYVDIVIYQDTINFPYNIKVYIHPQLNVSCNFLAIPNYTCDFSVSTDGTGAIPNSVTLPPYSVIYDNLVNFYASSELYTNQITCIGIKPSYGSDAIDKYYNYATLGQVLEGPWTTNKPTVSVYYKNLAGIKVMEINTTVNQLSDVSSIIYFDIPYIAMYPDTGSTHVIQVDTDNVTKCLGLVILESNNATVTIASDCSGAAFASGKNIGFSKFCITYY